MINYLDHVSASNVEQELLALPEYLSSPLASSVTRSLALCVMFLYRCLSLCPFLFGHCVVCFSSIYRFWLPLWYLVAIVLSVLLLYTDSDYPFGIFWPLCCLFFFYIQILITPLVSCSHCVVCFSSIYRFWLPLWYLVAIVLSVLLLYTDSDYPFGIL